MPIMVECILCFYCFLFYLELIRCVEQLINDLMFDLKIKVDYYDLYATGKIKKVSKYCHKMSQ